MAQAVEHLPTKDEAQYCQALVAYVCNQSYWEAKIRRIVVQGQFGQIV
jgi:hypothetical protein